MLQRHNHTKMYNNVDITNIIFGSLIFFQFELQIVTWQIESKDTYCSNNDPRSEVSTQIDCQYECLIEATCIGISYSPKSDPKQECYLCKDDVLTSDLREFSFYRRNGNT